MSSATIPRSNSQRGLTRSGSNRRTSGSRTASLRNLGSNGVPNGLDFAGLEATINVMEPTDPEYDETVLIFLSSRYQMMGPFHRQHKETQLILKEQWVEYWTTGVDEDRKISRRVAAKIFDTCGFLAKGKSGVTPTGIDNLQKQLPRRYRSVTSSGASRQLSKFSWYVNGAQRRDVSRPSQVLTPQKYEELIARLRAEAQSAKEEVVRNQRGHEREVRQLEDKVAKARTTVKRLRDELDGLRGT